MFQAHQVSSSHNSIFMVKQQGLHAMPGAPNKAVKGIGMLTTFVKGWPAPMP